MYHTHWIVPVGRSNYHITLFDPVYFKHLKPKYIKKLNSVALVCTRTIPTERLPPVGEVSANFCG